MEEYPKPLMFYLLCVGLIGIGMVLGCVFYIWISGYEIIIQKPQQCIQPPVQEIII